MNDHAIKVILREAGLRVTPQRLAVVAALARIEGHGTVGDVLAHLAEGHPRINAATVYRTISALEAAGLAQTLDHANGVVFEWVAGERHHHLHCTTCGIVAQIPEEPVMAMSETLEGRFGF